VTSMGKVKASKGVKNKESRWGLVRITFLNGAKHRTVIERIERVFGMYLQAKNTSLNKSMIVSQEKALNLSINLPANQRALISKGGKPLPLQ